MKRTKKAGVAALPPAVSAREMDHSRVAWSAEAQERSVQHKIAMFRRELATSPYQNSGATLEISADDGAQK